MTMSTIVSTTQPEVRSATPLSSSSPRPRIAISKQLAPLIALAVFALGVAAYSVVGSGPLVPTEDGSLLMLGVGLTTTGVVLRRIRGEPKTDPAGAPERQPRF